MAVAGDASLFLVASLVERNCYLAFCRCSAGSWRPGTTGAPVRAKLRADLVQVLRFACSLAGIAALGLAAAGSLETNP